MNQTFKPWEKVSDPSYFRKVLGNFSDLDLGRKHEGRAHVRFGTTGNGHAPNYQIESDDGSIHCFMGLSSNHKLASEEQFEADHLSEERFTYSEVQGLLARLTNGTNR